MNIEAYDAESLRKLVRLLEYENRLLKEKLRKENIPYDEVNPFEETIDVGGGLRGIYAAGVLDYCMDKNIRFDLGIGVSAGSANLASYGAGQRGRNYQFYTEYAFRKEYMSLGSQKNKIHYGGLRNQIAF